jgi:tRNA A-37 threonylcarbamoyl transferase component Bud32
MRVPHSSEIADRLDTAQQDGWMLTLAGTVAPELRESVVRLALDTVAGTAGKRVRSSLHADTSVAELRDQELFIKIIRRRRGLKRLKRRIRGGVAEHVVAIAAALERDGLGAPAPLLWGSERRGGREIIMTARAGGILLPRFLREAGRDLGRKRTLLHALGTEIARLHLRGYLHGDLTPFNILCSRDEPDRFILLDHERTRRTWLSRFTRPRLRNLVQLGHFSLPGLTRTDKMRVWRAYAEAYQGTRRRWHSQVRRLGRMIRKRLAKDLRKTAAPADRMVARGDARKVPWSPPRSL